MNSLTDVERTVVIEFAATEGILRSAIEKFCAVERSHAESECADNMKSVPRNHELASDYASQAGVYKEFLAKLEAFAKRP